MDRLRFVNADPLTNQDSEFVHFEEVARDQSGPEIIGVSVWWQGDNRVDRLELEATRFAPFFEMAAIAALNRKLHLPQRKLSATPDPVGVQISTPVPDRLGW